MKIQDLGSISKVEFISNFSEGEISYWKLNSVKPVSKIYGDSI